MIRGIPHHAFKQVDNVFTGRLTQGRKQGLGFAHATMLPERRQCEHPLAHPHASLDEPSRQKARDEIAGFLLRR
jgi:hypothetical protein